VSKRGSQEEKKDEESGAKEEEEKMARKIEKQTKKQKSTEHIWILKFKSPPLLWLQLDSEL